MRVGHVALGIYLFVMIIFRPDLVDIYSKEKNIQSFVLESYFFMLLTFAANWILTLINGTVRAIG